MEVTTLKSQYDIVIVGGGLVGASFACALQNLQSVKKQQRLSILLVEAFKHNPDNAAAAASFDARTTALSQGSAEIYKKAGLWEQLKTAVVAIREIQISDKGHFGSTRLGSEQQKTEALGYVVENKILGQVLHRRMRESHYMELAWPARIQAITPRENGMDLDIAVDENGSSRVRAALVVLADGGKSPICEQSGIARETTNYDQHAIICNISFQKPHNNIAYERFTETGPLAVLPLKALAGENRGSLIWTVNAEDSDRLLHNQESDLLDELQEHFGYRLGKINRMGERFCFPLSLSVATEQIRPGLVLLGNVAHTLHPVAGQGLNLALRDMDALIKTLVKAVDSNESPGSMAVLQRYLLQQKNDQQQTIGFTHYITQLFSTNRNALIWARKFGLFSIDVLPIVKQQFARQAMGLGDR